MAVKLKQFGEMTRQKYAWHPARDLCKRFNVPNPYPDSQLVGAPALGRRSTKDYSSQYSLMDMGGLRDTASELASSQRRHRSSRFDQKPKSSENGTDVVVANKEEHGEGSIRGGGDEPKKDGEQGLMSSTYEIVPLEFLAAIFGDDGDNEVLAEEEEVKLEDEPKTKLVSIRMEESIKREAGTHQISEGIAMAVTINDLIEDDDVYGPAMPPSEFLQMAESSTENRSVDGQNGRVGAEMTLITVESDSDEEVRSEKRRRKKEEKRKKRQAKKEKRKKKAKRKRRNSTTSSEEEGSARSRSD